MPAIITYPGLLRADRAEYTASLGISPGVAQVVGFPEESAPATAGDLVIGDTETGVSLILRDCQLDRVDGGLSPSGNRLTLVLLDRRWRWQVGPAAAGHFNQTDRRSKLMPWTVRSPRQLALTLLALMGEAEPPGGWQINLPAGLAVPEDSSLGIPPPGPGDVLVNPAQEYLDLGENLPPTGTNPTEVWGHEPAAACLARLCDKYGRAVCFDPVTDAVSIVRLGDGPGLPAGPCLQVQAGLDPPEAPAAVRVVGSPTRYQVRLKFRAVGRDWDGSWRPLDELSYAPGNPGDTARWSKEEPGGFAGVQPTDRLSWWQARALALESVYRCYQLVCVDPADPDEPTIPVPGYQTGPGEPFEFELAGRVEPRFRIVLQDSRPEQIEPRPGDVTRLDPVTQLPFAAEFYDGYSKDRPPQCYGKILVGIQDGTVWSGVLAGDAFGNTAANSSFYIRFDLIDPERQVVRFDQMLYRLGRVDGGLTPPPVEYLPADLVIETGVFVLDAATNEPARPAVSAPVSGGTGPVRTVLLEQVARELIGRYAADHTVTGSRDNDAYWLAAGGYYASALAATYEISGALTQVYVGVVPVSLGGRVRQVTWSVSTAGYLTTASLNTEHAKAVIPYHRRRRAENQPPDPTTALLNRLGPGAAGVVAAANAVGRFVAKVLGGGR